MANIDIDISSTRVAVSGLDRRIADERAASKRFSRLGYLALNGEALSTPFTIREMDSETAVLVTGGWMGVPERFSLFVEPDGVRLDCAVMLRNGNALRLRILSKTEEKRPRVRL